MVQAVTMIDAPPQEVRPGFTHIGSAFAVALGIDCRVEAIVGKFGCSQDLVTADNPSVPVITSRRLVQRFGAALAAAAVRTDLGRTSLSGAVGLPALDRVNDGNVVVFPMKTAQRLFARPGRIDAIYVQRRLDVPETELRRRLEVAVGGWNGVLGAADPPPAAGQLNELILPLFGMLSLFALGVGGVLVYNAISLSIEERRRELAITAALGGAGRTVAGGVLAEVGALGLIGGLLGTMGGTVVARGIIASLNGFTERGFGVAMHEHVTRSNWITGAVLGVIVAGVSAWAPARRAMRMDVAAELSNRELRAEAAPRVGFGRAALWVGVGLAGVFGCWVAQRNGALERWQATLAPLAFVVSALGFILAIGNFAPLLVRAWGGLLRGRDAPFRLGASNLVREPGRTRVMAIAVGSAVAVAVITASFNESINRGISSGMATGRGAKQLRVSSVPPNNALNIDTKLPPEFIERLASVPGVARVNRSAAVLAGHELGDLVGVIGGERPYIGLKMLNGSRDEGALRRGEGVLIGPGLARIRGLRAGSTYNLATPDGFRPVKVIGVWENGDFGGRHVFMSLAKLEDLYGPQPSGEVFVDPAPGVSAAELQRRIFAANQGVFGLQVQTPKELLALYVDEIGYQLASFWAIQRGLMVVAFVAVLATLLLVGVQRRRELGLLGAVGMQPVELGRMVVAEAGLVGLAGSLLAALASVGIVVALVAITPVLIGYRDPFAFDVGTVALYGAIVTAIVAAAALLPAWRTSRVNMVEALQYE